MSESVTREYMERVFEQVKTWGRWGPEDERGALNYLTDACRATAAALVRDGVVVSCARDLAVEPGIENPHPAQHMMVMAGDSREELAPGRGFESSTDWIGLAFHGMATSHIDALCHVFVRGQMYNGAPAELVKSTGAKRNSIMAARDGIAGRGVLLDLPRLRGVEWLELGERITVEDLEAAENAQRVRVGEGDILLVGTGRDARRAARGAWVSFRDGLAGLHPECIPWLHERCVAVLGGDGISDALPPLPVEGWPIPIHQCCLVAMGIPLLDNLELSELSRACASRRRWEFLFTVAPLRIPGGTGSPVNPLAIF